MKAKINRQLLNTTTFDSGSLGIGAMVIHQFPLLGEYRVVVRQGKKVVKDIHFSIDDKSVEMQLDIDFAGRTNEKSMVRTVSPKGYVLFYTSSGTGYSVIVFNKDGDRVFDSRKLSKGDLFALSLLEPTKYTMSNTLNQNNGEIVVSLTPEMARNINNLETTNITVDENGFDTASIELTSSQGLVFHINTAARILIEKKEFTDIQLEPKKPISRWQRY